MLRQGHPDRNTATRVMGGPKEQVDEESRLIRGFFFTVHRRLVHRSYLNKDRICRIMVDARTIPVSIAKSHRWPVNGQSGWNYALAELAALIVSWQDLNGVVFGA